MTGVELVRVVTSVAFLGLYALAIPKLGFFASTGLFLVAHMLYLGIRSPGLVAGVTAGTLLVFFLLFERLLGVVIPHGFLY